VLQALTSDQEFFRDTIRRFLNEHAPPDELRRLRDDPKGFDTSYWKQGADLGWTSLLVAEEHGGGSISGNGVIDLTVIAHEFGSHAAPGPLVPTNLVALALSDVAESHDSILAGLLSGNVIATWAHSELPPHDHLDEITLSIGRAVGEDLLIDGVKGPVEAAESSSHALVTGHTDEGLTQALVPLDAQGITIRTMGSVDLTRRFSSITFERVRVPASALVGRLGSAAAAVERQSAYAQLIASAESVGAMQRAFDMTLEWTLDRYSFGRPLASYQEIKHRCADLKTWLEASHAISKAAATALQEGAADAAELVSAAKAYTGIYGTELLQDCVQLHGGVGLTFEHDIHLYLRRGTLNRGLFGTPQDHQLRLERLAAARLDMEMSA
jgi:alkylation response protein AidB-like acyl-CoA dehydrogenase